jgi:protease-4
MSLDADHIVDRRRMRRKLAFWRVLAVAIVIAAVVGVGTMLASRTGFAERPGGSIARVTISGLIRSNQERVDALDRLGRSQARAVIVHINSAGGTTVGAEELHQALLRLKARKPLVVMIDGMAASGAYITAIAADHIVAQEMSLVGSIGPKFGDMLKTIGVKVEEIKSSPLKAAPNGYSPTSPEARAALESLVMDSYVWFRDMVKERRQLDEAALATVADGRVFTGRQAIGLKLIDALGNERTAISWLAKEKKVDPTLPVRDYKLTQRISDLGFLRIGATVLDVIGLDSLGRRFEEWGGVQAIERLNLDGLLAVWHPPSSN